MAREPASFGDDLTECVQKAVNHSDVEDFPEPFSEPIVIGLIIVVS